VDARCLVRLEGISKIYTNGSVEIEALRRVSFEVQSGEFLAIVGPSGSGKSTLLNVIGCLDSPSEGAYHLDGQKVSRLGDGQRSRLRNQRIGFVFQAFNLIPDLTVVENVELPLVYGGIKRPRSRALATLEQVAPELRVHQKAAELSGGEQQRAAIARAIVNDPQLLLADEPTGSVEWDGSQRIVRLLRSLADEGRTVVMVTHDVMLATMAHRRLFLKSGQVLPAEAA
jgi:putative ABC transport system ATP-binding protein